MRQVWHCKKCDYTTRELEAPMTCPICYALQEEFDRIDESEVKGY